MKNRSKSVLAFALWICLLAAGLCIMADYENTPGKADTSAVRWPAGCTIPRATEHATLVMLAHPRCPCTRASVSELAVLMARCRAKLKAYVLFFRPRHSSDDWANTELWRSAAAIPGVHVVSDAGGVEADRFHAVTSGHTLLYDTNGSLLFSGGITVARGLTGDSPGRSAIAHLVNASKAEQSTSSVFGCPLVTPNTSTNE